MEKAMFGAGCFWGVEDFFRQVPGVSDAVSGYAGGTTDSPTYRQVCDGDTYHAEVVEVTFDPAKVSYAALVDLFFKMHNPTQLNRQGPDFGTQYRSGIYVTSPAQRVAAEASRAAYGAALTKKGFPAITTEILDAPTFYYAEDYHQQYLAKNPAGYCGLGGTGVACQIGTGINA